jgi:hypothetical protein
MRTGALVLVVAVICALSVPLAPALADTGSISRDARGSATYGDRDVFGGPPTPRIYGFGQTTIFVVGTTFLVLAAALGAYTLITVRRTGAQR